MKFQQQKNETDLLANQLRLGRSALFAVLVLTLANLVLLLTDTGYYMLFSASVPYYLTLLGMDIGYSVFYNIWNLYTYIALGISAIILLVYLLCWLQSKNHTGWLTAGLVLFALDTLCLLGMTIFLFGNIAESIMDYIMHALVLYELTLGVLAAKKIKEQAPVPAQSPEI